MIRATYRIKKWRVRKEDGPRPRLRGEGGFSLLEAMVAAAVLGLGILAIAAMQGVAATAAARGNLQTLGANLAESRMEEIRLWCQEPLVTVVGPEGKTGCINGDTPWQTEELNYIGEVMVGVDNGVGAFTRRWTITIPDPTRPRTRRAIVEVSWSARMSPGSQREVGEERFGRLIERRLAVEGEIFQMPL